MKVRTLINKLLNYDMDAPVEFVIHGEEGERFSCNLKNDCVDEDGGFDNCPVIFDAHEVKDDDESIQDLIIYKHCLIDSMEKKNKDKKKRKVKDERQTI